MARRKQERVDDDREAIETMILRWADGRPPVLIGKWFHILDDEGYAQYQGVVVAEPIPGDILIVRLFDWSLGTMAFGFRAVKRVDIDFTHWRWYPTGEEMREAYGYGGLRRPESR